MERETGIEPASLAWKAKVLPLNYSRWQDDAPESPRNSRLTLAHDWLMTGDWLAVRRLAKTCGLTRNGSAEISVVEEAGFEPA